jgi:hypothetical protein
MPSQSGEKIDFQPSRHSTPHLAIREGIGDGLATYRRQNSPATTRLFALWKMALGDKTTKYHSLILSPGNKGRTQVATEWRQNSPPFRGEVLSPSPPPLAIWGHSFGRNGAARPGADPQPSRLTSAAFGVVATKPGPQGEKGFVVATGSSAGGVA